MSTTIALSIPDAILQKARSEADATNQSLEEVLIGTLADAYAPYAVHPERDKMAAEMEAFEAMHSELVRHHLGQFVAIKAGRLIDSDPSLDALVVRIQERYPDEIVLIEEVQPLLPAPLRVHAPRFRGATR